MKIKAGLKGRPSKSDKRDMRLQCDYLHCDAQDVSESYVLAAVYLAMASDQFPQLGRALSAAAKQLYRKAEKARCG